MLTLSLRGGEYYCCLFTSQTVHCFSKNGAYEVFEGKKYVNRK